MPNEEQIITRAHPHSVRKFKIISEYVKTWVQKLLKNNPYCKRIIFIDCMCNSGEYQDNSNELVKGTPLRVAEILKDAAYQYPDKQIDLYLNDIDSNRVNHLQKCIREKIKDKRNFHIHFSTQDKKEFLEEKKELLGSNTHVLLLYDPYEAVIDWPQLKPFLNTWGEVIINHMVSDSLRAVKRVTTSEARRKYEDTYQSSIENLIKYGNNRDLFEQRIQELISDSRGPQKRKCYIAAFPFFNNKNTVVYYLIHCTTNIEGFKLYKKVVWQTFGGCSSTKNCYGSNKQLSWDFDNNTAHVETDENCYTIADIANYIQKSFSGKINVPRGDVWKLLDEHPVFPSNGFTKQICNILKKDYNAKIGKQEISFKDNS